MRSCEKKSHQEFLLMFEAILGFLHISVKQNLISYACNQIQGKPKNILDLSADWTRGDIDLSPKDIVITFIQKLEVRPLDFYKSIYWKKEQLVAILSHCSYVIFAVDYSAG